VCRGHLLHSCNHSWALLSEVVVSSDPRSVGDSLHDLHVSISNHVVQILPSVLTRSKKRSSRLVEGENPVPQGAYSSSNATTLTASAKRLNCLWRCSELSFGFRKAKKNCSDRGLCAALTVAQTPLVGSGFELLVSLLSSSGASTGLGTFDRRGGLSGLSWDGGLTRGLRKRRAVVEKGRRNMMDVSRRGFCLMALAVLRWKGASPSRGV
jgi:hypothetical protein